MTMNTNTENDKHRVDGMKIVKTIPSNEIQ